MIHTVMPRGPYRARKHRAKRRTMYGAMLGTALLLAAASAQAARECEDPNHVPAAGACARMASAEIFYYDSGQPRGRQGETVIFVHAASGNADAFRHNLAAFHAAGYRAIAYDRKNVGRSSNTLRDAELGRIGGSTVQDLDDLATFLGAGRFHLVGVAAGAQVALQYAAKYPGKISSIVLAATLGPQGLAGNEPELARLQSDIALPFETLCPMAIANPPPAPLRLLSTTSAAMVSIPEVTIEHRELGTWFRATDRDGVNDFLAIGSNARHRTFDGCRLTNIGANQPGLAASDPQNPNSFAKIASLITMPTLLLAGTGDLYYSPPVHMKLWGSYIPDAAYVQLDTGHAPQFEDPGAFNRAVIRFLSDQRHGGGHGGGRIDRPGKKH